MSSDNFARATAAPRRLELGGEAVYVRKLTPRALGLIQSYFIERLPNPYESARDAIAELSDDEARAVWTAAVAKAQRSWPPDLHSAEAIELLSTPEAIGVVLFAVAAGHTRGLTRERAIELALVMSSADANQLLEAVLPGELGDIRDPGARGDGLPYTEVRARLCEKYPGWTFDTVDNMTFDQIADAWRDGKPPTLAAVESDDQVKQIAARWREYYVGL